MRNLALGIALALATLGASPPPIVQPPAAGDGWTPDAIARLGGDLDAVLASSSAVKGAHVGVYAIDTATGTVLYAHNADDAFQPASTLKLVVGSAALDRLGSDFTFETTVTIQEFGRVMSLVGGGDPTLASADFTDAARTVAATHAAFGFPQIDATRYDDSSYPNGWTWDDFGQDYAPLVSAMTYEENLAHMHVVPGQEGDRAIVTSRDAVSVAVPGSDCLTNGPLTISIEATTGPKASDDTVDVTSPPSGCPAVTGSIPVNGAADDIAISVDPNALARASFERALKAAGVRLYHPTELGGPGPHSIWEHKSQPLAEMLGPRFWIPSDNLFAELLLKELGFATGGKPGTTAKGITYEKQWLQSIGVDPATTALADGCGMSQYDRITPHDLVTILQHDWNGPNRQTVLDSLPVGGARGTIEGIAGTPVAGRVFAKTGSMMHVRGLAGYLAPLHHGAVTFAFNVDDWLGDYPALAALRAQVLTRIATDGQ